MTIVKRDQLVLSTRPIESRDRLQEPEDYARLMDSAGWRAALACNSPEAPFTFGGRRHASRVDCEMFLEEHPEAHRRSWRAVVVRKQAGMCQQQAYILGSLAYPDQTRLEACLCQLRQHARLMKLLFRTRNAELWVRVGDDVWRDYILERARAVLFC